MFLTGVMWFSWAAAAVRGAEYAEFTSECLPPAFFSSSRFHNILLIFVVSLCTTDSRHDKNRSVLSYILLHTKITVFSLSDLQLSSFSHPYSLSGALTWFIKSSHVSTPRSKLNRFLSAKVAGLTVVAVHRWPPEEDNYKIMFCYRLTCTCSIMTLAAFNIYYIHTH